MDLELIKNLSNDQEFMQSLYTIEDGKQVQEKLKEKGVELSIEQLRELRDLFDRYVKNELTPQETKLLQQAQSTLDGELNEDQLETVSGGWNSDDTNYLLTGILACVLFPVMAPVLIPSAIKDVKKGKMSW